VKKSVLWAASAALALAALLYSPSITIDIPEAKVRSEVATRLPMTIEKNGVNVLVRSATIDFLESDAIHIVAEADIAGYGLSGAARADVTSGLRYESGAFYLAELDLGDIEISLDQARKSNLGSARDVAGGILGALRERAEALSPGAGAVLEDVEAATRARVEPAAREALDRALASIPVYDLKGRDLKHDLAALAVEDVNFTAQAAQVRLDPGTLVLRLLLAAAALVLAFGASLGWMLMLFGVGRK